MFLVILELVDLSDVEQSLKKLLKVWSGESADWSKSETKLAVLAIIFKKSRKRNQTITAFSIHQIKAELKHAYNKDLSERQILSVIQNLGTLIIKEKDPRNHRRTLYRINPNKVEEMIVTLIKLDNENGQKIDSFEGILCYPLLSNNKKKFLAISHRH